MSPRPNPVVTMDDDRLAERNERLDFPSVSSQWSTGKERPVAFGKNNLLLLGPIEELWVILSQETHHSRGMALFGDGN